MRSKSLVERPLAFGVVCAMSAVLIGVLQDKTWEQQWLNVGLGLLVGTLVGAIGRWLGRRGPS